MLNSISCQMFEGFHIVNRLHSSSLNPSALHYSPHLPIHTLILTAPLSLCSLFSTTVIHTLESCWRYIVTAGNSTEGRQAWQQRLEDDDNLHFGNECLNGRSLYLCWYQEHTHILDTQLGRKEYEAATLKADLLSLNTLEDLLLYSEADAHADLPDLLPGSWQGNLYEKLPSDMRESTECFRAAVHVWNAFGQL